MTDVLLLPACGPIKKLSRSSASCVVHCSSSSSSDDDDDGGGLANVTEL